MSGVDQWLYVNVLSLRRLSCLLPSPTGVDYRGFIMDGESTAFFGALHLQKTLVGMRVQDVRSAVAYLSSRPEIDSKRITLADGGTGGVVALHAAALEPGLKAVTSINALASYKDFAETDIYTVRQTLIVPRVFESFDLPDVAALIAPRPVTIINPIDAAHRPVTYTGAPSNAKILRAASSDVILNSLKAHF